MSSPQRTVAICLVTGFCLFISVFRILPIACALFSDKTGALSANSTIMQRVVPTKDKFLRDPIFGYVLRDEVSCYERRFSDALDLARAPGSFSYISDSTQPPQSSEAQHDMKWLEGYVLTMYALAPIRLVDDAVHPQSTGIINCAHSTPKEIAAMHPGITIQRDFGNGVALFQRSGEHR
jgi:hypothetical protein